MGLASLMRPDRPLPTCRLPCAATPRPKRCRGDHRGLDCPVALHLRPVWLAQSAREAILRSTLESWGLPPRLSTRQFSLIVSRLKRAPGQFTTKARNCHSTMQRLVFPCGVELPVRARSFSRQACSLSARSLLRRCAPPSAARTRRFAKPRREHHQANWTRSVRRRSRRCCDRPLLGWRRSARA